MVFSNLVFLFVFLPVILVFYFIVPHKLKNYVLLLASLIFYAWGEPRFVFLMLFSIFLNYIFGLLIDRHRDNLSMKKLFLTIAVIGNLLILGVFKYANFFLENIGNILGISITVDPIPLPIGISFFTFQAISYIIDVYRRDVKVQRNLISLSLFISLFPQLMAGPIIRYNTIAGQIKKRIVDIHIFTEGVQRFIIGLSKKVIVANSCGEVVDVIFSQSPGEMSVATAWIGVIAYALQIYFDFSGYSDMAIGLAKMFGFNFMENFNYPYIARSVSEFWRRWHISLGSWFKDYVYIPLGGNRKGYSRTIINLLIVWTITGFWHGASWTFVAWGFYFGVFIVLERIGLSKILDKLGRPAQHFYVFIILMVSWVFFRADNFTYSFSYLQTMFGLNDASLIDGAALVYLNDYWMIFLLGIVFSLPVIPWMKRKLMALKHYETKIVPVLSIALPVGFMVMLGFITVLLVNSTYNPFIYFRF